MLISILILIIRLIIHRGEAGPRLPGQGAGGAPVEPAPVGDARVLTS